MTDRSLVNPGRKEDPPMKAAVVHDFTKALSIRMCPSRSPAPVRFSSRSRPLACATPTSMRPTAIGRSSRRPPFIPGHEGVGIVEEVGPGVKHAAGGRPGRHAVARRGLRRLRVLHRRLGDAV